MIRTLILIFIFYFILTGCESKKNIEFEIHEWEVSDMFGYKYPNVLDTVQFGNSINLTKDIDCTELNNILGLFPSKDILNKKIILKSELIIYINKHKKIEFNEQFYDVFKITLFQKNDTTSSDLFMLYFYSMYPGVLIKQEPMKGKRYSLSKIKKNTQILDVSEFVNNILKDTFLNPLPPKLKEWR